MISVADSTESVEDVRPKSVGAFMLGGAMAGLFTDAVLYPLDTLKTRQQSESGLWKSGGFRGVYKGMAFTSSITPISSRTAHFWWNFFGTYVTAKRTIAEKNQDRHTDPFVHMFSSLIAQVVSSAIDVPAEAIKQRRQTSKENISCAQIAKLAVEKEGVRGLYRGFASIMLRDTSFVIVEMPFWEWMRGRWKLKVERELTAFEAAICGAVACSTATTLTTPFDVVQTHIILANAASSRHSATEILSKLEQIYLRHGVSKLFSGFIPRFSISLIGGGLFFGVFDLCNTYISAII